jgi:hypothetical protein
VNRLVPHFGIPRLFVALVDRNRKAGSHRFGFMPARAGHPRLCSITEDLRVDADLECALRDALEIATRRRNAREALRRALVVGDTRTIVECARALLGVVDEEGDRPPAGE